MISNNYYLSGVKAFGVILRCKTCRKVDFFGPRGHFTKKKGNEEIVFEPSQKVQAALKFWSYLCNKPVFDENTLTLAALGLFVCVCVCAGYIKAILYALVLDRVPMSCKQ